MISGSLSDILKKIITTQTQQFAKETLKIKKKYNMLPERARFNKHTIK